MAECLCSVLCVKPYSGYYPACPKCMRKLTEVKNEFHEDQHHPNRVFCRSCVNCYSLDNINWNYCIALIVTDGMVVSEVVTFGHRLNLLFGWTAQELHRYLLNRFCLPQHALPLQDAIISDYLIQAITTIMVRKIFKFHFKWQQLQAHQCYNGSSILDNICRGVQGGVGCVTASHMEEIHAKGPMQGGSETVAMALQNMLIIKENVPPSHQETQSISRFKLPSQLELSWQHHYTGNSFYDQFNDDDSVVTTPLRFDADSCYKPDQQQTISASSTFSSSKSDWTQEGQSTIGGSLKGEPIILDESRWNVPLDNQIFTENSSVVIDYLIAENSSLFDKLITGNSSLVNELITDNSSLANISTHVNDFNAEGFPPDGLSCIDYKHLIDEIKEDWLLTQPDSQTVPYRNQTSHTNHSLLPYENQSSVLHRNQSSILHGNQFSLPNGNHSLLPHNNQSSVQLKNQQSHVSPFWKAFHSTLSDNTDQPMPPTCIPQSTAQHDNRPTSSSSLFVTPKLKRKLNYKRQAILTKPHKYTNHDHHSPSFQPGVHDTLNPFQPIASSTPSVSTAKKNVGYHQLNANNTEAGYMSSEIL